MCLFIAPRPVSLSMDSREKYCCICHFSHPNKLGEEWQVQSKRERERERALNSVPVRCVPVGPNLSGGGGGRARG